MTRQLVLFLISRDSPYGADVLPMPDGLSMMACDAPMVSPGDTVHDTIQCQR
jgi:hypothetical protein